MSNHYLPSNRFSKHFSNNVRHCCSGLSLLLLILVSPVSTAFSVTVVLTPVKDNTIYSENSNRSNGAGAGLFAGTIRQGPDRRALMNFDVKGAVPTGATIESVSLRMVVTKTHPQTGSASFRLHRLTADWGEGSSNGSGQGATATTNDATWSNAFTGGATWTAGGAIVATPSATASAGDGAVTWASAELLADVQAWVNEEQEEFGWALKEISEGGGRSAKRFGSREGSASNRPTLTIDYILPKTDQTITFSAIPNQVLETGTLTLEATATSALPISFAVISGPATVEGNVLTFTGTGAVTVRASQAGDDTFNPALDVDQTFNINKSDQTIAFNAISDQVLERGSLTLAAMATSELEVSFSVISGPATVEGNLLTFAGVGTVTVQASQAGNEAINPALDVDQTFDVINALDDWLMTHFTAEELLDLAISGDEADADLDGFPNGVEYVLFTDPRIPSSLFTGNNSLSINAGGDAFILDFSRNRDAVDATITIEESVGLNTWTVIATSVNGAAFETSLQGYIATEVVDVGGSLVNVSLSIPITFPAASFQRIMVVR